MSIIHVNQIKNHVLRLFDDKIEMDDAGKPGNDFDNQLLTRSLAAYAIHYLSGASKSKRVKSALDSFESLLLYCQPEKKPYRLSENKIVPL
jgi:hypothetical protein